MLSEKKKKIPNETESINEKNRRQRAVKTIPNSRRSAFYLSLSHTHAHRTQKGHMQRARLQHAHRGVSEEENELIERHLAVARGVHLAHQRRHARIVQTHAPPAGVLLGKLLEAGLELNGPHRAGAIRVHLIERAHLSECARERASHESWINVPWATCVAACLVEKRRMHSVCSPAQRSRGGETPCRASSCRQASRGRTGYPVGPALVDAPLPTARQTAPAPPHRPIRSRGSSSTRRPRRTRWHFRWSEESRSVQPA